MTASIKLTLLGAVAAFALAAFLGGRAGVAVSLGYVAGAAAALAIGAGQRALAQGRPGLVIHLVAAGFVAKVFLLLAVILAVRFAGVAPEALDARTFVLAFAGAVLLLVPAATIDLVKLCMPLQTGMPLPAGMPVAAGARDLNAPAAQAQGTLP